MRKLLAIACLVLFPAAAMAQSTPSSSSQNLLLDKLVGNWNMAGLAHGNRYTWTMQGEWVLSHQFLRLTEKSAENIVGVGRPFEAVYYFSYDDRKNQYFAHLLKNFGSENGEVIGYSEPKSSQLTFIYKLPEETVSEQFTWQPTSKSWLFQSWGDSPDGKRIVIIDAKIHGGTDRRGIVTPCPAVSSTSASTAR
jgi:hypothetical protein